MMKIPTTFALLTTLLIACDARSETPPESRATLSSSYAFASSGDVERLDDRFEPPSGFRRAEVRDDSFGAWLRGLPVLRDRKTVRAYDGRKLDSPSAAIVDIDVGDRDLQQCADSAIRLHAEWLWSQDRTDHLAYHFTSGDEVTFRDWVNGERIKAIGSKVTRWTGAKRKDDHASMRRWLDLVFRYAGTRSLHRDSRPVKPGEIEPGDFFVAPGSPGHAVVVLDVAKHPDGRRVALLGQGFMPAQDFHVLRHRGQRILDGVWFVLPDDDHDTLKTPSWKPFSGDSARRFVTP